MENTKIREWYMNTYPTDDVGKEINAEVTFYDLFKALDTYKDVYDTLGVTDSLIRERAFQKLAEIMDVGYNYIYNQWVRAF